MNSTEQVQKSKGLQDFVQRSTRHLVKRYTLTQKRIADLQRYNDQLSDKLTGLIEKNKERINWCRDLLNRYCISGLVFFGSLKYIIPL
jgi:hypothetical protein